MKNFAKFGVWLYYAISGMGIFLTISSILTSSIIKPQIDVNYVEKAGSFLFSLLLFIFARKVKKDIIDNTQWDISFFSIHTFSLLGAFFLNFVGTVLFCFNVEFVAKNNFTNVSERIPNFISSIIFLCSSFIIQASLLVKHEPLWREEQNIFTISNMLKKGMWLIILLLIYPHSVSDSFISINRDFDSSPGMLLNGVISEKIPSLNPFYYYKLNVVLDNSRRQVQIDVARELYDQLLLNQDIQIVERSGFLNRHWFIELNSSKDLENVKNTCMFFDLMFLALLFIPINYLQFMYLNKRHLISILIFQVFLSFYFFFIRT